MEEIFKNNKALLLESLKNCFDLYMNFSNQDVSISLHDAEFQAYQKGCKAAISNLEALIKITQSIDLSLNQNGNNSHLEEIIATAEKNIAAYDAQKKRKE